MLMDIEKTIEAIRVCKSEFIEYTSFLLDKIKAMPICELRHSFYLIQLSHN